MIFSFIIFDYQQNLCNKCLHHILKRPFKNTSIYYCKRKKKQSFIVFSFMTVLNSMYTVQKQQFVCREQQKNETAGSTKLPLLKQLFYCPPVVRALSAHTLLVHVIQFYSTFDLLVPVHNELIRFFVFYLQHYLLLFKDLFNDILFYFIK